VALVRQLLLTHGFPEVYSSSRKGEINHYAYQDRTIDLIPNAIAIAVLAWVCSGCASSETQVQKAAKDWCMTIRGSQVIPVYPLTEDIQPGDIFLFRCRLINSNSYTRKTVSCPRQSSRPDESGGIWAILSAFVF